MGGVVGVVGGVVGEEGGADLADGGAKGGCGSLRRWWGCSLRAWGLLGGGEGRGGWGRREVLYHDEAEDVARGAGFGVGGDDGAVG